MWYWLYLGAAAVTSVIPQFGVLAVPALVIASQRLLGIYPARRNQLAALGMGLPTPLVCLAPLWSTHAWWQRVVLGAALAMAWSPLPPALVWAGALAVAVIPLFLTPTRDAVRWLMPLLTVAARVAWPQWWDVVLVVLALLSYGVGILVQRPPLQWWSVVLVSIGLASGAGVVVLPWLCVVYSIPTRHSRVLACMAWWGLAHACLSAGLPWGIGIVAIPVLRALPQLTWTDVRRGAGVMLLWLVAPLDGAVARLQTSLGAYGDVAHDTSWQFIDAAHRMVGGLPWQALLWCLGLAWAVWQLTVDEVAHD